MSQWYLRTQDETFGPESQERLVEWAKVGRIQPGQEISDDNEIWRRVEDVPFLDMRFSIDLGDGNPRGPFNRAAAEALLASGRLPPTATMVETREPFPAEDAPPPAEPAPAAPAEPPVRNAEPPVKVVEKIVEVPVEKIVEKVVVDEARVAELTRQVEEGLARAQDLQSRLEASEGRAKELERKVEDGDARARELAEKVDRADAHAKELEDMLAAATRVAGENEKAFKDEKAASDKLREQVRSLEDELRRLPQTASEVADVQAAVYAIMTGEAEELAAIVEAEKKEAEAFARRHAERADRLMERRRTLLKRAGANIEEMTRRALVERPEDPRAVRLRKEYEEFRRQSEKKLADDERRIRELGDQLRTSQAETARVAAGMRDVTQLRGEIEDLKARLQHREQELLSEKQSNESLRQQQATSQQALMARLMALESPSIGTPQSLSTNQSREAKLVKLPSWMRIGK